MTVAPGTILRGRIVVMDGDAPYRYGCYRVTAVKRERVYVSWVSGHRYCNGVCGQFNQWIHVDDLGRFEVVSVSHGSSVPLEAICGAG